MCSISFGEIENNAASVFWMRQRDIKDNIINSQPL